MKLYAIEILGIRHDKYAGFDANLRFTYTSIRDTVKGSGRIFQLSRVEMLRILLPLRDFMEPGFSSIDGTITPFALILQSDVPGSAGYQIRSENIESRLVLLPNVTGGSPIVHLLWVITDSCNTSC